MKATRSAVAVPLRMLFNSTAMHRTHCIPVGIVCFIDRVHEHRTLSRERSEAEKEDIVFNIN